MDEINPSEKSLLVSKTVGALLFSVFGFMGFFFSLWRSNYNSAICCFFLEVICVAVLVFNKMYLKKELHLKFSAKTFQVLKYVQAVFTIACLAACVTYVVLGVLGQETFSVRSHYSAAPIAFLTGFWSLILFFDYRKYESLLE